MRFANPRQDAILSGMALRAAQGDEITHPEF
jgi:hypothetical protein